MEALSLYAKLMNEDPVYNMYAKLQSPQYYMQQQQPAGATQQVTPPGRSLPVWTEGLPVSWCLPPGSATAHEPFASDCRSTPVSLGPALMPWAARGCRATRFLWSSFLLEPPSPLSPVRGEFPRCSSSSFGAKVEGSLQIISRDLFDLVCVCRSLFKSSLCDEAEKSLRDCF